MSTFSLYLLNLPDVFQLLCWPSIARIQTFTCSLGISPSHGNLLLTSFPMGGLANPSLQPIRWTERETAFHSLVTPYLRKEVREHRAALCSLCAPKLFFFFFPRRRPSHVLRPQSISVIPYCVSLSRVCTPSSRMCRDPDTVSGTVNKRQNSLLGLFFTYS